MREYQLDSYIKYGDCLNWIDTFIVESKHLTTVKLLLPYYMELNKCLYNKQFKIIDYLFEIIDVKNLSDVLLNGLLRLCYRINR